MTVVRVNKDSLLVLGWLLQGSINSLKFWYGKYYYLCVMRILEYSLSCAHKHFLEWYILLKSY